MKIYISIIIIIFSILSCNKKSTRLPKSKIDNYKKIESLLVNEYNVTDAKKLWLKSDSTIDKNNIDSIYWVHQLSKIYLLIFENYIDSAAQLILENYPLIDSSIYKDIYYDFRQKEIICEMQLGQYSQSINHSFNILPYFEIKNVNIARGLKANIGWAYFNLSNWDKAKKYTLAAIQNSISLKNYNLSDYYQRMAGIYAGELQFDSMNRKSLYDSSILYFNKSLACIDTTTPSWDLFNFYNNKAGLYGSMGMYNESINEVNKAIKVNNKILDLPGIVSCYDNIGNSYYHLKKYKEAISILTKAESMMEKYGNNQLLSSIHKNLAASYLELSDYKKAALYYQLYFKNYITELEKTNIKKTNLESQKFETNKAEIEKQMMSNRELKSTNDFQKLLLFSISSFLLIFILFILWFNQLKYRKKLSILQHEHEKELLQKQTEQNERLRISRNLHDNLGAYASSILNKINLLESNINKNLPQEELSDLKISAHQILSNLKNIVIDLNQKPLSFIEFIDQIKTELLRLMKSYPDIEFNINEQIEYNSIITPENQLHLKSIIFEIINNALKHSHGNEISFDISENLEFVEIKISDNGKYSSSIEYSNGNGIENIKSRISILNGYILLHKNEIGGTSIELKLPKSL